MAKSKTNMIEVLYNDRKTKALMSENYSFTRKNCHFLHEPLFAIKEIQNVIPGLTYKKVNDWDNKKLVSGKRQNEEAGWRKFSIVDIMKIRIIAELRKFGVSIEKIQKILDNILNDTVKPQMLKATISDETPKLNHIKAKCRASYKFLSFEYFIFDCLEGNKVFLLVDNNNKACFFDEADFVGGQFIMSDATLSLLILPFFDYMQDLTKIMQRDVKIREDSTIRALLRFHLTEQERKILDVIRNKEYEEVTVVRSDGNLFTLRAKTRRRGDFKESDVIDAIKRKEYQTVTVSSVAGKQVSIIREETIRV